MMQTATAEILHPSRKRTMLFETRPHWVDNFFAESGDCIGSLISVIGKPLIVHNVEKLLAQNQSVDRIMLPRGLSQSVGMLQRHFPSVQVGEYDEGDMPSYGQDPLRVPLNSAVLAFESGHIIKPIVYPWDVLKVMMEILDIEIRKTTISKDASVAETAVIKGPCIIEDGVQIDDFNKIVGPVYIGKNSRIGTGNLIRKCVIEKDSSVGFGCEIARSILVGKNRISHHDVILDSVVGQNVWMGAFVGTTNLMLNNETIKYRLGDSLVSTGLEHFGCVIGHDSAIGAGVIILPGRSIPKKSIIQANTVVSK